MLRDVTSERPEIHNPGIQGKAIQVAKAKGILGAIYTYYATLSRGAEATDTCTIVDEPQDNCFYAWMFMLFIFVMGMAFGWLLKTFLSPKEAKATQRSVATQSQTTYTELRGVANPRFHPLPDTSHGAEVTG